MSHQLSIPSRVMGDPEPCISCGVVTELQSGREGGHRVYCLECAGEYRPHAVGASKERTLSNFELDERDVYDVAGYRRRQKA